MSGSDTWTCLREVAPGGGHIAVLLATPVAALSALGLSPDEENALLRGAWEAALEELPAIATGHRLSWRSLRFDCVAELQDVVAGAQRLLARLTRDHAGRTTWHLALAEDSDVSDPLRMIEDEVAAMAKRGALSSVAIARSS